MSIQPTSATPAPLTPAPTQENSKPITVKRAAEAAAPDASKPEKFNDTPDQQAAKKQKRSGHNHTEKMLTELKKINDAAPKRPLPKPVALTEGAKPEQAGPAPADKGEGEGESA